MFRQCGWRRRAWAVVWAVLQFALPAGASIADARLEHESRSQVMHVEATSATTCRPVHPAECALCQLLTHSGAPAAAASQPLIASVVSCGVAATRTALVSSALERLPLPRAPPAA